MPSAVRTVLFSTLYPSSIRPLLGVFVETRLRELLQTGRVQSKVVAPVAWVPKGLVRGGRPAAMAATPLREVLNGIDVRHPRYFAIPKFGMTVAPLLLALAARPALRQLQAEGFDFDVIDAHYYYPDGVAAAILGRWFAKPVAITARGTDINLIPEYRLPRLMIQWAAEQAAAFKLATNLNVAAQMQGLVEAITKRCAETSDNNGSTSAMSVASPPRKKTDIFCSAAGLLPLNGASR